VFARQSGGALALPRDDVWPELMLRMEAERPGAFDN
jgi:hypothetical protein